MKRFFRSPVYAGPLLVILFLTVQSRTAAAPSSSEKETEAPGHPVSGTVRDSGGAVVPGADVVLQDGRQVVVGSDDTDAEGRFHFLGVRIGNYLLIVKARGFAERRVPLSIKEGGVRNLEVKLELQPVEEYVTVTAHAGLVEDIDAVSQRVNVITEDQIGQRAKTVVAQVVQEETGVALQRTGASMSGIFVRGLTGDKVSIFVDGFRYSHAGQRGGVNTFLNLIDPSNLQSVEVLRGPNSAQFGSDSIGGSVQFFSRAPVYAPGDSRVRGQASSFFNSADLGYGLASSTTFATSRFGVLLGLTGRRVNTLRPGDGVDSHNSVTRFLGLPSSLVIDGRLPGTAFTQYGGMLRMNWSPAAGTQFTVSYHRSQQDGGRRYDQTLGGDGNLIADLRNLMLDFFYVRFDKAGWGWFDSVTLGYSFNTQREERVNQGGGGNPLATITHDKERTFVNGLQGFVNKQAGQRHNLLLGGEFYHERIDAPSFGFSPATSTVSLTRPRVPNDTRYHSGGVYLQDVMELIPKRLRATANVRVNAASYEARATASPVTPGGPLWPDDSLTVAGVTYRFGMVYVAGGGVSVSGKVSRGFRAPLATDLGTLGLTGSGFEVAAPDVSGLGGTVGSTADNSAVSTGLAVQQLDPETSLTYEFGVHYRNSWMDTDFAFFVNDIDDLIAKQALILPPGAVGLLLGTEPVIAQDPSGIVFVAPSPNPVLVRANFDEAQIRGIEYRLNARLHSDWTLRSTWTWIHAKDPRTGLPPNVEGGIPAPDVYLSLRYAPSKHRWWVEPYLHAAARQSRISSLDLNDRRTGGGRSRSSIARFFNNGARARGLIGNGPDMMPGTADDVLLATGETLLAVQDRVLGVGVNSAPLFPALPGYAVFGVRGGFQPGERHQVVVDLENIGDRNYRGSSWGLDAPGIGVSFRYTYRY